MVVNLHPIPSVGIPFPKIDENAGAGERTDETPGAIVERNQYPFLAKGRSLLSLAHEKPPIQDGNAVVCRREDEIPLEVDNPVWRRGRALRGDNDHAVPKVIAAQPIVLVQAPRPADLHPFLVEERKVDLLPHHRGECPRPLVIKQDQGGWNPKNIVRTALPEAPDNSLPRLGVPGDENAPFVEDGVLTSCRENGVPFPVVDGRGRFVLQQSV